MLSILDNKFFSLSVPHGLQMCILQIVSVTYTFFLLNNKLFLKKKQKEKIHNFKAKKNQKTYIFDIYLKLIWKQLYVRCLNINNKGHYVIYNVTQ